MCDIFLMKHMGIINTIAAQAVRAAKLAPGLVGVAPFQISASSVLPA